MKRVISLLLSLVIIVSTFACVDLSVFAVDENDFSEDLSNLIDIDIFKAQCYLGIAEDTQTNAVELCNNIYNSYTNGGFTSPTKSFLDSCYDDASLMDKYDAFMALKTITDSGSVLNMPKEKEDYYKSIIIGVLYKSINNEQSDVEKIIKNKTIKYSNSILGSLAKEVNAASVAELSERFDIKSSSDMKTFTDLFEKKLPTYYSSKITGKVSGKISKIITYSTDVIDLSNRLSAYAQMAELDDMAMNWLLQMKSACDYNTDPMLITALDSLISYGTDFAGQFEEIVSDVGYTVNKWAVNGLIDAGVGALAGSNPVLMAAFAGLKAGKLLSNLFFAGDSVASQFFTMQCIYKVEDITVKVVKQSESAFLQEQSTETAQTFLYSVDNYFELIANVDFECMEEFLDTLYNGGVLSGFIKWIYGATNDYQECVDALEGMREARNNNYHRLTTYYCISLEYNYHDTWEYYYDTQTIKIKSISFNYNKPFGYPEDYADVIVGTFSIMNVVFEPFNTTQKGYSIVSDNESVVRIYDDLIIGVSEGTANITITSTDNPNISYTKEIKVGKALEEYEPLLVESRYTYETNDDGITITGLVSGYNPTKLKIPSQINGKPVVKIEEDAFRSNHTIKTLSLPYSLTEIGDLAFCNCDNLESVKIPDTVNKLGQWAFKNCNSVQKVSIGSGISRLWNSEFANCTNLKEIEIPCSTEIEGDLVYDPFQDCSSVEKIILTTGTGEMFNYGGYFNSPWHYSYENIREITICDGIKSISSEAFCYLSNLTTVTIPDSIINICDEAFASCNKLTNLYLPKGLQHIGKSAFSYCRGLTNICIPKSVISIGEDAFNGCTNLNEVYYQGNATSLLEIEYGNTRSHPNYFAKAFYIYGNLEVDTSVSAIDDCAFCNCINIERLVLPDSITSIGYGAFSNCGSLKSINIPKNVKDIGAAAFRDCKRLENVVIESIDINYGGFAFCDCTNLKSLTVPCSSVDVSYSCFYGCSSIESVTITKGSGQMCVNNNTEDPCYPWSYSPTKVKTIYLEEGIENISRNAFSKCSIETITIPNSVTKIEESAFSTCENLARITIPNSVTTIGDDAFYDCSNLTSINIGDSVTSIGKRAFTNCKKLTEMIIPNSVKTIGEFAFSNCTDIKTIVIPNSVTSISDYVFYSCKNLQNIELGNNVTHIGESAFSECNISCIYIPNMVETIGTRAFDDCSNLGKVYLPKSLKIIGDGVFDFWDSNIEYYYCGTEEDWDDITIGSGNYYLLYGNERIHYNVMGDHEYVFVDKVDASCENEGYSIYRCPCGYEKHFDIVPILEHKYQQKKVSPKCQKSGYIDYSCTECGYTYREYIEAIGHKGEEVKVVLPTCTNKGYTKYKCSACGETYYDDYVDAIGHSGYKITTVEATCTNNGYTEYECTTCGDTYRNDFVYAQGHNYVDGICNKCGKVISNNSNLDDYDYALLPDWTIEIQKYKGDKTAVTIPEYIDGYSVSKISDKAFYNCKSITSISLPESLECIGTSAFEGCTSLSFKDFVIGENITSIGERAFYGCKFSGSLTIPEGVSVIGDEAFGDIYNCFDKIYYNAGKCYMSYYDEGLDPENGEPGPYGIQNDFSIFPNCQEIVFGNNVRFIPTSLLANNKRITSIVLPQNLYTIQPMAFYNCENLTDIGLADNIYNVGFNAFEYTPWYESLDDGFVCIGKVLYDYKGYDDELNIPEGIKTIAALTYGHYYPGKKVFIPKSVERIDCSYSSFSNAKEFVVDPENDTFSSIDGVLFNKDKTKLLAYPKNNERTYYIVPTGVEIISNNSFYDGYNLQNIVLGKDVKRIDDWAFSGYYDNRNIYILNKNCLIEDPTYVFSSDVVIYGYSNSTAEEHADNYEYEFRPLDKYNCGISQHCFLTIEDTSTCTSSGNAEYLCVLCGYTYSEEKAGNHDFEINTINPTCINQGYTEYCCSKCGYSYETDYVPATGQHNYINGFCKTCNAKDPTFVVPESKTGTYDVRIQNEGDYYYTSFTPSSNGTIKFYSTGNDDTYGYLYDEKMSVLTYNDDSDGSNFCVTYDLQKGKTYYLACRYYSSNETGTISITIEFTSDEHTHSYTSKVTKAATCAAEGIRTYTCTECEYSYMESIPATGKHSSDNGTVTKKATPTATGTKVYKCTVCGQTIKTETIAKTAKYNNTLAVKAKKPTVKYSKLKKKNQTIALKNWATVTKAQGKVTYKKSGGNKKITVASNGKITVKKGLKRGTYKIKVKVTASGNATYKAVTKTVTVTIIVK